MLMSFSDIGEIERQTAVAWEIVVLVGTLTGEAVWQVWQLLVSCVAPAAEDRLYQRHPAYGGTRHIQLESA